MSGAVSCCGWNERQAFSRGRSIGHRLIAYQDPIEAIMLLLVRHAPQSATHGPIIPGAGFKRETLEHHVQITLPLRNLFAVRPLEVACPALQEFEILGFTARLVHDAQTAV